MKKDEIFSKKISSFCLVKNIVRIMIVGDDAHIVPIVWFAQHNKNRTKQRAIRESPLQYDAGNACHRNSSLFIILYSLKKTVLFREQSFFLTPILSVRLHRLFPTDRKEAHPTRFWHRLRPRYLISPPLWHMPPVRWR